MEGGRKNSPTPSAGAFLPSLLHTPTSLPPQARNYPRLAAVTKWEIVLGKKEEKRGKGGGREKNLHHSSKAAAAAAKRTQSHPGSNGGNFSSSRKKRKAFLEGIRGIQKHFSRRVQFGKPMSVCA